MCRWACRGSISAICPGDGAEAPRQIPLNRALKLLKPLLEDPSVLKVGHNIKYDMHVMAQHGITVAPIDDSRC